MHKNLLLWCLVGFFSLQHYAFAQITLPDSLQGRGFENWLELHLDSLVNLRLDSLSEIEEKTPQSQDASLEASLNITGTLSDGNVNRQLLDISGSFAYQSELFEYSLSPQYSYGFQNNALQEDEFLSIFAFSVFHERVVYGLAFGSVQTSNLRKINFRWDSGAGLGFHLVQRPRARFSITTAVVYENTDFISQEEKDIETLRLSTRFKGSYKLFNEKIRISHVLFVQPSLVDEKNYRFTGNLLLQLPLSKHISFTILAEDTYESIVIANSLNNDFNLLFGLSLHNF